MGKKDHQDYKDDPHTFFGFLKIRRLFGKFRLPELRLRYKILLYLFMLLFIILSLISAATECFSDVAAVTVYAVAAVTMVTGVCYLVRDIRHEVTDVIQPGIRANPYTNRYVSDYRLRTVLSAVPGLAGNLIFSVFNGAVGILSHSAWFGSLSAYYILLSMMRIGAVLQARKNAKEVLEESERTEKEAGVYRASSWLFIVMSIVLAGMVILLEASLGGKSYPGVTIYAIAFYTFYRTVLSVIHMFRANKQRSPLLVIIRRIGYIDACVSMLTLQTAMFASFSYGQREFERMMNGITGSVVCLMVLGLGIYGVCVSRKMKDKSQKN